MYLTRPGYFCVAIFWAIFTGPSLAQEVAELPPHLRTNQEVIPAEQQRKFKGKFGGRVLFDMAWLDQSDPVQTTFGGVKHANEWRRLRLQHAGAYAQFRYKMQIELAKEHMFIEDLYVEAGKVPVIGNVRIGHMKEPFLLEMQTSSNDVFFMERAVTTIFSSGRNLGIMLYNRIPNTNWHWSAGAFRDGLFDVVGQSKHFGYNLCGRFSGLVLTNSDNSSFIHVGVGIKHSLMDEEVMEFSSRPEAHLAEKYISSGELTDISRMTAVSSELVLQSGRWSFQSEMVRARALRQAEKSQKTALVFPAYMAQLSWFVTRDRHQYKNGNAGFDGIAPARNLFEGGIGALELAARYSRADLSDANVSGCTMDATTFGMNWYPNQYTRVSTNYVLTNVGGIGRSNILEMRFQIAL